MTLSRAVRLLLLTSLPVVSLAQTAPQTTPAKTETAVESKAAESKKVPNKVPNRAAAYYHYTLAHNYEEQVAIYQRSDLISKAIEEYKLAIENDPENEFLNSGLAELYAKTNRIRDAVVEAQNIIKRDPNNLDARKLLGRIYLRSLGDMQSGTQHEVLGLAIQQFEEIVRLDPKASDSYLLLGRLYILNKDLLKAENAFKTALKIDPSSEEAVTNLAYLYNEQGETNKAAATLNSVPDQGRSAKLYSALGYTYEQQKDYKKAIEAYKHAVEIDKDNLDAVRGLAQNLLNDGQVDAALEKYKAIIEEDPQDAQAQLRIAEIQRRTGKLDAALESLKKAESLVQDSLEVPYNFALVYSAQGRYDEAIQTLQTLLDKTAKADGKYTTGEANNRSVFLERLAGLYRETGKSPLALETYRKMFALGDENATRAYQEIIDTYREDKQWNQATAIAEEAAAKFPQDRNLKLMLAGQLADTNKPERGISLAKSLLKGNNNKDDREIYIALSQIYSRLRQWTEAENAALMADKLSANAEEKVNVAFVQGSIYERQKKFDLAEERFRHVLASDPQNAMALNYLGYMLADRGVRLDEALGYIKKALEIDPQNGAYLDSIGWAYYKLGNYEMAEDNLRKAVAKAGNDATLHDHLGDVYYKTGRLKLAAAHWERAIEEWNRSVPSEIDTDGMAKVQKKLESAKVKLAKQQNQDK